MTSDTAAVVEATRGLTLAPRGDRWTHLTLCVLDAVYSINANYDRHTLPTVRRYAALAGLGQPEAPADRVAAGEFAAAEVPVTALAEQVAQRGVEGFAAWVGNRQRTSPAGPRKSEAAGRYAAELARNGVMHLADVPAVLADPGRLGALEGQLRRVPGEGSGVRRSYLWMLAGDDHHVKPDRMVLGWLRGVVSGPVDTGRATELLVAAAGELGVTPWQVDHAIWLEQRKRTAYQPAARTNDRG